MNEFKGFPAKMQFTPVPNIIFSTLLPGIEDPAELKTLLYFFYLLYSKKGNLRYVSLNEIAGQSGLLQGFKGKTVEELKNTLEELARKGVVLHLQIEKAGAIQDLYFLNSEAGKSILDRIVKGDIEVPGFEPVLPVNEGTEPLPDIYTLYEQNVGLLTPLVADEMKEAVKHYPENWIREAIAEAAALNRRNWRYIARILEHWATEGKNNGTHRRNTKQNADPDKYIRGRYGHMVQR
ncbi:MAG: DnaD domain protein [Dehalococcoidales bacterium]|nr:DnaD domain protein [Dehalococcoidales bacterium]